MSIWFFSVSSHVLKSFNVLSFLKNIADSKNWFLGVRLLKVTIADRNMLSHQFGILETFYAMTRLTRASPLVLQATAGSVVLLSLDHQINRILKVLFIPAKSRASWPWRRGPDEITLRCLWNVHVTMVWGGEMNVGVACTDQSFKLRAPWARPPASRKIAEGSPDGRRFLTVTYIFFN